MAGLGRAILAIERLNAGLGRAAAWLVLAMTLIQAGLVVLRYVFGAGSLMLSEAVTYMYAFVFMLAAGYTMAADRHVRVDVFYRRLAPRGKAAIDLAGTLIFVLPLCWFLGREAWPYVARSWAQLEGSRQAGGLPLVFVLKTAILVFVASIALQALAWLGRSVLVLLHRPVPPPLEPVADPGEEGF